MEDNALVFLSTQLGFGFSKPLMGPESLFVEISNSLKGIFNESPTINPIPFIANDPRLLEVHVVDSVSIDSRYELKIARGRMDLFVNTINNEADYGEIHSDLIAITERLLKCLEGKVDVEWVGFINSYILKTDISKLSDKVFNENILNINAGVTNSFSAKHANRFDVQNTLSNNQLSVSTGSAKKGEGEEMEGLIIVQDFNTKPTPKSISFEFVKSYVEEAKELIKINEIVKLLS